MILVTGGAGYIGSHVCVELINAGYEVGIFDNFSNSSAKSVIRVEAITNKAITVVTGDIRDEPAVKAALTRFKCSSVLHFAGTKAVQESCESPLRCYDNNVLGSVSLLKAMQSVGLKKIIFSSSATVYGSPNTLPLSEDHVCQPESPYARSKLAVEEILNDVYRSDPTWKIAIFRYFNPIGAHKSGLIGDDPKGVPSNLMPMVVQLAIGRRDSLSIWGNDYPTPDGTGVRDYVHVVDIASAHVAMLEHLNAPQCVTLNLGTGRGTSVLGLIEKFSRICGKHLNYKIEGRRPGDVAAYYADASRASGVIGWSAQHSLEEMCADQWHWQLNNPSGYEAVWPEKA